MQGSSMGSDQTTLLHSEKGMNRKSTRFGAGLSTGGCPQQRSLAAVDALPLPAYVSQQAWRAFVVMRGERRAPLSLQGARLVLKRLMAMHADGYCPTAALEKSVRCGWRDVYPADRLRAPAKPMSGHSSTPERSIAPMPAALAGRVETILRSGGRRPRHAIAGADGGGR